MSLNIPASNKFRFLLAAVVGFCLFFLVLYLEDIPLRIENGERAQAAIQQLDAMRRPMLAIKALEDRVARTGDFTQALQELDAINSQAETILGDYLELTAYDNELLILAREFARSYTEWVARERWMISYLEQGDSDLQHKMEHYAEADRQLLNALTVLGNGEEPLHRDIYSGQLAVRMAQASAIALMTYLFFIIVLFQRTSARELMMREQDLDITLTSIGDAVITTDIHGRITRMNPVAEELTGWLSTKAVGLPLSEVFVIESTTTGEPVKDPVAEVLEKGQIVGLANHTVLVARDGNRYQIADSAAPIKTGNGAIRGVVLVFHDVTRSYEVQQTVREQASRLNNMALPQMEWVDYRNPL